MNENSKNRKIEGMAAGYTHTPSSVRTIGMQNTLKL